MSQGQGRCVDDLIAVCRTDWELRAAITHLKVELIKRQINRVRAKKGM